MRIQYIPMNRFSSLLRVAAFFLFASTLLLTPAQALDPALDNAKAAGQIGETAEGYLAAVPGASVPGNVQALMSNVNSGRQAHYTQIANNTPGANAEAVGKIAGKKLVESAPSGQYVRTNGVWAQVP